jgi:hypothetical protein
MIRLLWAIVCRSSAIDRDSNILSLFDILEEITVLEPITEKGQAPVPSQLVMLWGRSKPAKPVKSIARVSLVLPSGQLFGKPIEVPIDLTRFKRLRHRIQSTTFPVAEEGVHEFLIEFQASDGSWTHAASVPVEMVVKPTDSDPKTTTH